MAILLAFALFLCEISATAQTSTPATTLSDPAIVKRYFEQALVYPKDALNKGIKGRITVTLEVMPDGKTQNYSVERGIEPMMNAEAIRLARHILWKPAMFAGQPQKTVERLTIEFNPKSYHRNKRAEQHLPVTNFADTLAQPAPIYSLRQLAVSPQPLLSEGFKTMNSYLVHLIKYPEMAIRHSISGTVVLDFVIETNGLASNIRIRESVGGGCDQEAIRILEQMLWIPGRKDEQAVRTYADIEIAFRLSEHQQRSIPNQRSTGL